MTVTCTETANRGNATGLVARARASRGTSEDAIYRLVGAVVGEYLSAGSGTVIDIGCGTGAMRKYLSDGSQYMGVDAVRYDEFPPQEQFIAADLDQQDWPVPSAMADACIAVEVIEHLENPRAFFREITRVTKPGGLIVVTTPNQLSLLSKLTLVLKNRFNAFQDCHYPVHRTALLEIDLLRIAKETDLANVDTRFTNHGRIPGTKWHWPARLGLRGRAFSDNICMSGTINGDIRGG